MEPFAVNKRARFDYEILDTFEAGLALTGLEAKSAKMGRANLQGSHAILRNGEAFVVGISIQPFQEGNASEAHKPDRTRKLLLTKKELKICAEKLKAGLTLVPLSLYNNRRGFLKLELGLGRGKKQFDKRETIKKRETEREIRRFAK